LIVKQNFQEAIMDQLQQVQLRVKLKQLEQASGSADQLQLRRLKKMKLGLKDQITTIENLLIPNIIA
jgi:hypothetical protein